MSDSTIYIPLFPGLYPYWPRQLFDPEQAKEALKNVYMSPVRINHAEDGDTLTLSTGLMIDQSAGFHPLELPGLEISLGDGSGMLFFDMELEIGFSEERFVNAVALTVENVMVTVKVMQDYLREAERVPESDPLEFREVEGTEGLSLHFTAPALRADSTGDFSFGDSLSLTVPPFFIGKTGIVAEASGLEFYFSAAQDSPPGTQAGFKGIYFQSLKLYFTENKSNLFPEGITAENFSFGTGGISGTVSLDWAATVTGAKASETRDLAGFAFTPQSMGITLVQSSLASAAVKGFLKVPFFDSAILVEASWDQSGTITLSLACAGDACALESGPVKFTPTALKLESVQGDWALSLSGKLSIVGTALKQTPSFEIQNLCIDAGGNIRLESGWLDLGKKSALDFNSVKLEVSQLGFGSKEIEGNAFLWIGLSGGVAVAGDLPMGGGLDGLKILWRYSGPSTVELRYEIASVHIWFEIPELLTLEGTASFSGTGFSGGLSLNIIPLEVGADAQFAMGEESGYSYFYASAGLSLPKAIPVIPPAVGLKGMQVLFGSNYVPDKRATEDWYGSEDTPGFYLREPEGIRSVDKWKPQSGGLGFGLGARIVSLPDDGFTVDSNVFIAAVFPGPILLIEGKAAIMSDSPDSEKEYPYKLLAVYDGRSRTFLFNIEARYKRNSLGSLIDLYGMAELYVPFGSDAWHLWLGKKTPESSRLHANLLFNIFRATAYLMLDSKGIELGGKLGYYFSGKFGPLSAKVDFHISGAMALSFKPMQAKAELEVAGLVELSAFGCTLGVSARAMMAASLPEPLTLDALVEVQLKTPLGNPKGKIKLHWEKPGDPGYYQLFTSAGMKHQVVQEGYELPLFSDNLFDAESKSSGGSSTASAADIQWSQTPVVPVDSTLTLNFSVPVKDAPKAGMNPAPDPGPIQAGNYQYRHTLSAIELFEGNSSTGPFTKIASATEAANDNKLFGAWQAVDATGGATSNLCLTLWTTTPFDYLESMTSIQSMANLLTNFQSGLPCPTYQEIPAKVLAFDPLAKGSTYEPCLLHQDCILFADFPMEVVDAGINWTLHKNGLAVKTTDTDISCSELRELAVRAASTASIVLNGMTMKPEANVLAEITKAFTSAIEGNPSEVYLRGATSTTTVLACSTTLSTALFPAGATGISISLAMADAPSAGGGQVTVTFFNTAGEKIGEHAIAVTNSPSLKILGPNLSGPADQGIRKITVTGSRVRIGSLCAITVRKSDTRALEIHFPGPQDTIRLSFKAGSQVQIKSYDSSRNLISTVSVASTVNEAVSIHTDRKPASFVSLSGNYVLYEASYLSEDAATANAYNSALVLHMQQSLDRNWGSSPVDILKPGKFYYAEVSTYSERKKNNGNWETAQRYKQITAFRTGQPAGMDQGSATGEHTDRFPLGGKLVDLSPYVQESVPAVWTTEKPGFPFYRRYWPGLIYNQSYVDTMYQLAGTTVMLQLKDAFGNNEKATDGSNLKILNAYGKMPVSYENREEKMWEDMLAGSPCASVLPPDEVAVTSLPVIPDFCLKPEMNYSLVAKAGSRELYTTGFKTSAFATFRHALHSFRDQVWYRAAMKPALTTLPTVSQLSGVFSAALSSALKIQQVDTLYLLNPAAKPARTEVQALPVSAGGYLLLLQSPEAMDWRRIQVSLYSASGGNESGAFDGAVKIVGSKRWVQGPKRAFSVDLLLMESAALNGMTLTVGKGTGRNLFFTYSFTDATLHQPGTLIRICSGSHEIITADKEFTLVPSGSMNVPPEENVPITLSSDAAGNLHSYLHQPDSAYTQLSTLGTAVPEDGSRTFLYDSTAGFKGLPSGYYRLRMIFKRDAGSGLAVLYCKGSSAEETADLHFYLA